MTISPQTEIEKKRTKWWVEHYKLGMSPDAVSKLNEELMGLYPKTQEERAQKAKDWQGVPEFVL